MTHEIFSRRETNDTRVISWRISLSFILRTKSNLDNRFLSTWNFYRNEGQLPGGVIKIQSGVSCIKLIHLNQAYAYLMHRATENQFKIPSSVSLSHSLRSTSFEFLMVNNFFYGRSLCDVNKHEKKENFTNDYLLILVPCKLCNIMKSVSISIDGWRTSKDLFRQDSGA